MFTNFCPLQANLTSKYMYNQQGPAYHWKLDLLHWTVYMHTVYENALKALEKQNKSRISVIKAAKPLTIKKRRVKLKNLKTQHTKHKLWSERHRGDTYWVNRRIIQLNKILQRILQKKSGIQTKRGVCAALLRSPWKEALLPWHGATDVCQQKSAITNLHQAAMENDNQLY